MSEEHPIDYPPAVEGVPYTRAWKDGRRIYVISGYKSKLSDALWAAGFSWDRDLKAHYVGTGKPGLAKLEQVTPAIREAEAAAQATAETKAAGHWVKIPLGPGMAEIREAAKKLGARFDGTRKEWALPTAETAAEVTALVAAHTAAKPARKAPAAPRPRRHVCDECGKKAGKHERYDSSGIAGLVCDSCDREPDYALSFA